MYKQVIVLRKDLNMRKGKMIVQGSHACQKAVIFSPSKHIERWRKNKYTKICVSVNSEQELLDIYNQTQRLKWTIASSLIKDAGLTEFKEPTYTAVAIGPGPEEDIDRITGHLPLL